MNMKKSGAGALSQNIQTRHEMNRLCTEAINRQIERGEADATQLRNRRRYLSKQILKRIPHASRLSTKRLLHAAAMVLAMWSFGAMSMPQQVEAAPVFKHTILDGLDMGFSTAPTFVDIDNDGDLDAFVSASATIVKFYRNTGSNTAPVFTPDAAGNPLPGVHNGSYLAFADIDNDGDLDAFLGGHTNIGIGRGTVEFYRNTGTVTTPVFTPTGSTDPNTGTVVTNPLIGVSLPSLTNHPTFADIDLDGDLDAFVGGQFGRVYFYRNTGNGAVPVFTATGAIDPNTTTAVVNPLAGVKLRFGAHPTFADIDLDGDLDAFVGWYAGTIRFYRNTGTVSVPVFAADAAGNPMAGFDVGYFATPAFADVDNDGDLDAFVGDRYGTIRFYRNAGTAAAPAFMAAFGNPLAGFDVGSQPIPTFADIDNDGDLDAFIGEVRHGTVKFYRNTGTVAAPVFAADAAGNPLAGFTVGNHARPAFADIDNDGDLDAFVGENTGTIRFYRNTGTATAPVFVSDTVGNPLAGFRVAGFRAAPRFVDIDLDGDLDAFVGAGGKYTAGSGTVKFYRNTGTNTAPVFAPANGTTIINPLAGFNVGSDPIPAFADIDLDGDLDAFVGDDSGTVKFYRNTGTIASPVFVADVAGNPLAGFDLGAFAAPAFADIDNDGDLDVFIGKIGGTVDFFKNFDPTAGVAAVAAPHDFNGDFKSDILFHQASTGRNFMTLMNGRAVLSQGFVRKLAPSWSVVGNGDYNGDGKADMLFHQASTGRNFMMLMNGRAVLSQGFVRKLAASWTVVGSGDYNGDGKADILFHQASTGRNFMMLMNGRAVLSQGFVRGFAPSWTIVGSDDYNGDGKTDMLFHQASTGRNFMMLMNGRAVLSLGFVRGFAASWTVVGSGDYNGDGKADMLFHQASTGRNFMMLMNGRAVLSQGFVRKLAPSWSVVGSGDYNGDGKVDMLFHQASTGRNFMMLMNGRAVLSQGFVRGFPASWSVVDTQ